MKKTKLFVLGTGLIGILGGFFSTPTLGDGWHRDEDRRRMEERRIEERRIEERRIEERRRWEELHRHPHPIVYAPAPVVYAPPPPSPGISIVLPIEIR